MKRTLLTLWSICLLSSLWAVDNIIFKHLGIKEGLSHSQVNHIMKDSRGFMWFSTSYGLNRYDGYHIKTFAREHNSPHSLTDNFIEKAQEDAEGYLWIQTGRSGYLVYNPWKETFDTPEAILSEKYGITETPTHIYIDKEKNLWFHRDYFGTYQYNIKSKKCLFYPVDNERGIQNVHLTGVAEDKNGIVYIYENGLIEWLARDSDQVIQCNDYLTKAQEGRYDGYSIFVDCEGDFWVYTKDNDGLWFLDVKEQRWEYISTRKDSPYLLNNNTVTDIKQDSNGLIWVATNHGGVNLINKELQSINYLINNPFDERSIIQNSLNCLFCDDNGVVWIGTYKRGVSYYNESIYKFKTDHLSDFNRVRNFIADVNVMAEDRQGNLWVGTNSSGLLYLNSETKERSIYQHRPNTNSPSSNVIVSLLTTADGKVWFGTYQGGLNVFDGHRFTHYRHEPGNPKALASDNIWALAEGSNNQIWVGTLGNGLQSLDPATGIFTSCAEPGTGYDRDYINSIFIGKDKNLYMSTADGITVFSPATRTFERWNGNKRGTQQFSHQNINQTYEDSRGLFWIATQEGINIYDRRKDEITILNTGSTHQSKIIHAIVEDNNRNMWVTTANGITNIIINVDPKTGVYAYVPYHYNEQDGLQNQEFNIRSIIKTVRGEIIAGGVQGLSLFDPENIKYNQSVPKVVFTDLQLFNQEIHIDSVYSGNRILSQALNRTSQIKLKYQQNMFSVSFSSMNYILPEKTQYEYMLEGFNVNWLVADVNKVSYTNLAPGKYTLKVRATNSDGFSNDEISELGIIIQPPFWLSSIAYTLYFLIIVGILLLARRQILRSERNKYQLAQIEQDAQQKHEVDDMKLRFFTNISHELRTPLTLIISPLENVIKTIENREQKQRLEMVHRNAIRLLNMVNQLLDFRKSDVKGHQLNPAQGDIIDFIRNISTSFTEYSEKKNVHLMFFSAVKELPMLFDEDKIGKIVMNLLSNAFKYTPEGGRVDLFISLLPATKSHSELLEIKVSDTGIGISDEDKKRIFERFYQVQHKDNHKVSGSGIGLHLVKEFVLLHDGTVTVCDNVGQGSVFVVLLPVTRMQAEATTKQIQPEEAIEELIETDAIDKHPVILIVDDNDDFRLFMNDSLKSDYVVKEASDGAKAWDLIPTLQPDIIVCDVMMPELDGIELCKLVKNDIRTSHIPLILLTARSAKEQKREGLETGADDYITKPFNFDILELRIKKLLQLRQYRQDSIKGQLEINPSEIAITSLDEKLMQKAIQYVESNISRSELSVEELSRELGMSRVYLYKKLLSITGKSPIEFIRVIRLKRAAQLLRESQQNVSEVAYQVGFNSPKYFSKYFKEEFGVLPSAYQEKEGR